ncbi:MAG: Bax inhibitor-1 family protein, partial [Anaerolineae bacterium]|nr:Bax inhibitor-1 family protein [Anaerolineae bacterium]
TKKDLSGMGSILFMALIGLIIATVVNMLATSFGWFPAGMNTAMAWILNYAGVVIFAGLTMWDAQKLKQLSAGGFYNADMATRASISGALMLYLDFINLFIFLLNILGGRRN